MEKIIHGIESEYPGNMVKAGGIDISDTNRNSLPYLKISTTEEISTLTNLIGRLADQIAGGKNDTGEMKTLLTEIADKSQKFNPMMYLVQDLVYNFDRMMTSSSAISIPIYR